MRRLLLAALIATVFLPLAALNASADDVRSGAFLHAVADPQPAGAAIGDRDDGGKSCECTRRGLCNSQQPVGLGFVCAFAYGLPTGSAWTVPLSALKLASHIPELDPPPPRG